MRPSPPAPPRKGPVPKSREGMALGPAGVRSVPTLQVIERFILRMERIGSGSTMAQAALFRGLLELRGRYLFAAAGTAGTDIGSLADLFDEAHSHGGLPTKDVPSRIQKEMGDFTTALREVRGHVTAFTSVRVADWKAKVEAAEALRGPLTTLRRGAGPLLRYPEFALFLTVLDGWEKDVARTVGFYTELGGALAGRDQTALSEMDLRVLDRDGTASGDESFEDHMLQLERLKIDLLLERGRDPAQSYARMLLLRTDGPWDQGGGEGGEDASGEELSLARPVRVISAAFNGLLLTVLAFAYLPLIIMAAAGAAGLWPAGSGLFAALTAILITAGIAAPAVFMVWLSAVTGFGSQGLKLLDLKGAAGALATVIVLALWGGLYCAMAEWGHLHAGLSILICALVSILALGAAAGGEGRWRSALTRYGLAHAVSLPLATAVVLVAGTWHSGGIGAGGSALGIPAQVEFAGGALVVQPVVILLLSFIASTVGVLVGVVGGGRK